MEEVQSTVKYVSVFNRNDCGIGYTIPDTGVHRTFNKGETKKIPLTELEQLQWIPGGDYMLRNFLVIKDEEVLDHLNMSDVEPEYFYTEAEIRKLLTEGTLDQLEDTLNFGTDGVKELIKTIGVEIGLPDTRKRKMILDKLGFNIDTAIQINEMMNAEEDTEDAAVDTGKRKAEPIKTGSDAAPERKASPFKAITPANN